MSTFITSSERFSTVPADTNHTTCKHCETSMNTFDCVSQKGWVLDWGWNSKGGDAAVCPTRWFASMLEAQSYSYGMKKIHNFVGHDWSAIKDIPAAVSFIRAGISAESDEEAEGVLRRYQERSTEVTLGAKELVGVLRELAREAELDVAPLWVAKRLNPVSARISGPPMSVRSG